MSGAGAGRSAQPHGSDRAAAPELTDCVVVGYDGSDGARAAVKWAARVLPPGVGLVLVHASRPLHAPAYLFGSEGERREYGRALIDELFLDGDAALLERPAVAEVSDHDPVSALTDAAHRHSAGAIVVGATGHSRLSKAVGTVTSELLAGARVPVVAVPEPPDRRP